MASKQIPFSIEIKWLFECNRAAVCALDQLDL